MRIETIREFVELCKHMNFTRAAAKLNITQPALSYHISAFEKFLGFKLLERGKQLRLTQAGRTFLSGCQPLLRGFDELVAECRAQALAQDACGVIAIKKPAVTLSRASTLFHVVNASFRAANPNIELKTVQSRPLNFIDEMVSGYYDCVLTYAFGGEESILDELYVGNNREEAAKIEYFPIATIPLCARVNRFGLLKDKEVVTPDDAKGLGLPCDCKVENDEITYAFRRMADLCGFDVDIRLRDVPVSGDEEAGLADDEIYVTEIGYPIVGDLEHKPLANRTVMTIYIAVYDPSRNEALSRFRDFLVNRPVTRIE